MLKPKYAVAYLASLLPDGLANKFFDRLKGKRGGGNI